MQNGKFIGRMTRLPQNAILLKNDCFGSTFRKVNPETLNQDKYQNHFFENSLSKP